MTEIENIALPLANYRRTIQYQSEDFFKRLFKAHDTPVENLTDEQCDEIIYALVDDFVTDRLLWAKRQPSFCYHQKVDEVLEGRVKTRVSKETMKVIRDEFYKDAIDEVWSTIRRILQKALPEDTWHMWWVRKMKHSIVLEKGVDYRIQDWESRMESGEWS